MLRNRELRLLILVLGTAAAVGTAAVLLHGPPLVTVAAILSMLCATLIYLWWRGRKLSALSDYLSRVTGGEYALDIQDNDEGELSVLKSEIYKVTHALSVQAQSLQEEKAFLADSISDISHQLKTPLTSVSIFTDLIGGANIPPERQAEFISGIRKGLDRVEWLVQTLLKLAKLDASAVEFQRRPVKLETLVRKAAEPLLIPMEIRNQTLTVEGDGDGEIQGDMAWLAEAVGNILKNCVEHTPPGGEITVRLVDNNLYRGLTVEDTEPGIAKEDLRHIFDRFYRGKDASKDSVGIGLALAHSIVKAQGGTLEAGNTDRGARFVFKFYQARTGVM